MKKHGALKWYAIVKMQFQKILSDTEHETCTDCYRSNCEVSVNEDEVNQHIHQTNQKMMKSFEAFEGRKKRWVIVCVHRLAIKTSLQRSLSGTSYIELSAKLRYCVLSIQTRTDSKCFLWSIFAPLYPASKNTNRVKKKYRRHENGLIIAMLKYPESVPSISTFEE